MARVKFGFSNVHYATITVGENNAVTYGTPVAIPGGVNFTFNINGEKSSFYADNIEYFTTYSNQGYSGTLELAMLPEAFVTDVLGMTKTTNGLLIENTDDAPKNFALLFEMNTDTDKAIRFVWYNVSCSRPNVTTTTITTTKTPQTTSLEISAMPALDTGNIKAYTTDGTTDEVYNGWYTSVQLGV